MPPMLWLCSSTHNLYHSPPPPLFPSFSLSFSSFSLHPVLYHSPQLIAHTFLSSAPTLTPFSSSLTFSLSAHDSAAGMQLHDIIWAGAIPPPSVSNNNAP